MLRTVIGTLGLCLVGVSGLWAQAPAAPAKTSEPVAAMQAAGFKIGFIDLERALLQVEEGKKDFGVLEKFVRDKENEAKSRQDAIEKLRKQLAEQDKNLKEDAKAAMNRDIEGKMTELERFTQDTQREIDGQRTTAINKIGNKMQPIINTMAKEMGYAAILVYSPSSPLYAYIDLDKYDVTNGVIERYNKATPVASNQPTPAKPPAAANPAPAKPAPKN